MHTFIVLTGDSKWDVLDPDVIGPFADEDKALQYIEAAPRWLTEPDHMAGGYRGCVIVSARTATAPDAFRATWDES